MANADRVQVNATGNWEDILNDEVKGLVASLQDEFGERIAGLREARIDTIQAAVKRGVQPGHLPPSDATTTDWAVPNMPDELWNPGIEISGPAHVTSMFINALNPGPDGERAEGDLDDDEDSASHILEDTLLAARNRKGAVDRSLTFYNEARDRHYSIQDGEIPFFMHRERGLHLDDPDLLVDGSPVSATILGTLLTLYHAGQEQTKRGQGVYFYLPKTESSEEAALYRDLFASIQNRVPGLNNATIRGILLVESLPLVWTMEESLHALGPLRRRSERSPLGPQSITARIRHGRPWKPMARPIRRRSSHNAIHRQHLPTTRRRLHEAQRRTHRRDGYRTAPSRPGSQRRSRRYRTRRQRLGKPNKVSYADG